MTKYLKIYVSGPYVNSSQESYVRLEDGDLGEDGECRQSLADDLVENAISNYLDSYSETVDEDAVPEADR